MSELPERPDPASPSQPSPAPSASDAGPPAAADRPATAEPAPAVDPASLERDLDRVEAALAALDAGTYGIDPATGEPLDDELLAADPTGLS